MKSVFIILLLIFSTQVCANNLGYDPAADPFAQVETAKKIASAERKHILVIAGGDWCRWCYVLDKYLKRNADVYKQLTDTFVLVKVYIGEDNFNQAFFDSIPETTGYPNFWILSADGKVIGTQSTGILEKGQNSYSTYQFKKFIDKWQSTLAKPSA